MNSANGKPIKIYYDGIASDLSTAVGKAYYSGSAAASKKIGAPNNFSLVNEEAVEYAKEYHSLLTEEGASIINGEKVAWLSSERETTRDKIAGIIEEGVANGDSTDKIAQRLSTVWSEMDSRNTTIARTEIARAEYHGTINQYKKADVSKVQWITGDKACEQCSSIGDYHSGVYSIDDVPEIPVHPNCSCDVSAIVGDDDDE